MIRALFLVALASGSVGLFVHEQQPRECLRRDVIAENWEGSGVRLLSACREWSWKLVP